MGHLVEVLRCYVFKTQNITVALSPLNFVGSLVLNVFSKPPEL
jgi:hypothetical protein